MSRRNPLVTTFTAKEVRFALELFAEVQAEVDGTDDLMYGGARRLAEDEDWKAEWESIRAKFKALREKARKGGG